ncbi:MAG: GspH/FimT family pseudopilin [Gammaproteobacteria bacterium]
MNSKLATGLTILELVLVLAISGITLGVGIPGIASLISANRVAGQVNALRSALALTRSEAIKRNQHTVLCKSADGKHCTKSGSWSQGWIVYIDHNQNRKRDLKETLMLVHGELANGHFLRYRGFGSHNYIVYWPTGFTRTNGTFTLCAPNSPGRSRALILTKTGRVRLSRTRPDGSPLRCDNTTNSAS